MDNLIFVLIFINILRYKNERFLIVVILLCFRMLPGQYNLLNRSVNVSIKCSFVKNSAGSIK
ncbi:hypothetical protein D8U53_08290 [Escherichia coli]|nr:hypothetical protein [Escherichia coli]